MRTCTRKFFLFSFFLSFVLFVSSAWAQIGTTSLRGTILDKSGAVVAGATVKLTAGELSVERTVVSTGTGAYEFPVAAAGHVCAEGGSREDFAHTTRKIFSFW